MKEFWRQVCERLSSFCLQLLERHPGKFFGAVSGFVLGLIFVLLGFWRTLVILLFILVGFFLGKSRDENRNFAEMLQNLFGERR